ncbi:hybrid sensor histidine kinase/response regulator transcription factor [Pararhodonellum marinum]|uniref:hybrid sensor histidine kinase/response regulator transcription factor n=1 Tax=Pararhodonellum marinum TaxID=2755358 RepID=UPI00188F932B|nr:two-component regulator propeller domain-containing protein [Pararhodonellum marinum]
MKFTTKIGLGFSFWIAFSWYGNTQSIQPFFENMAGQRGLPKNVTLSILQDKEGFVWFGTKEGLFRFDGFQAVVFQHDPSDAENTLPSNVVFHMHEDQNGRLWLGSPIGLIHMDKVTGKGTLYQPAQDELNVLNIIKTISEDSKGNLWLGTEGGIARFDPIEKAFEVFGMEKDSRFPLVVLDENDMIWGIKDGVLYQFHPKNHEFTSYPIYGKDNTLLTASALTLDLAGGIFITTYGEGLYHMEVDKPGLYEKVFLEKEPFSGTYSIYKSGEFLWISTGEGLQMVDLANGSIADFVPDANSPGSLGTGSILTTYLDRAGNLWVGTLYGVNKAILEPNPFQTFQLNPAPASFIRKENQIYQILEDQKGVLWLAVDDLGICKFDRKTGAYQIIPLDPVNPKATYPGYGFPMVEDQQGRLWAGTIVEKALFLWEEEKGQFRRFDCEISPTNLAAAPNGHIWMGSNSKGLASFDPVKESFTYYSPSSEPDGFPFKTRIFDLIANKSGSIWIVSAAMGVIKLEPQSSKFSSYNMFEKSPQFRINDIAPLCILEDSKGMIWLGTTQGGLTSINASTGEITSFTVKEGLGSNRVTSIEEDEFGQLWLGTNKGLTRFDPISKEVRNFGKSEGVSVEYFLENSSYAKKGKMFFGTPQGFLTFDPAAIQDRELDLPIFITQVQSQGKILPQIDSMIELPYDQNFVSFDFTAINFQSPDKTHFAYQLEGVDPDWVYSGDRRFVSYAQLRPGNYTFRVKASLDNLIWKEQMALFSFKILPPWWETWWAYLIYTVFAFSLLFGLRFFIKRREALKHELALKALETEKMQEIDHLKSRFFANISHEFRTPLTLILGPLETIIPTSIGRQRQIFEMMSRNARRLQHLINQLLDLSKLEAGSMKIEANPAAITSFLKVLILSFSSLAERREIKYVMRYPSENPIVYYDADKVEKIITNLISNAFKFSDKGGQVTVMVKFLSYDKIQPPKWMTDFEPTETIKMLELKVMDEGTGIPADQLKRIFDRFYQVDDFSTKGKGGSGIGLSMVRELVELYEGEIRVNSSLGEGTTFWVRLPMPMLGQEELAVVEPDTRKDHLRNLPYLDLEEENIGIKGQFLLKDNHLPLILLVEDNRDIRLYIKEALQNQYQVIEAVDGEEGLELAMETIPDLILSDVMMDRMDGVSMCKRLKNDEKTAHIPLILLTAKASGDHKIQGLESGADDYVIKPFEANELLVRIKNLIQNRKKMREHFSREILLQPAGIPISSVDEKFLQKIMLALETNMDNPLFGVEDLGKEANMSRMQLHRKLKAITDYSPGEFIKIFRLKRSAELLSKGAGNVSEVAMMVGFQDPSYFTKCFQKQFGMSPTAYLNNMANQEK